jgi:hypothetical protein
MFGPSHAMCREPIPGILPLLTTWQGRGVHLGIVTGKGPRSASMPFTVLVGGSRNGRCAARAKLLKRRVSRPVSKG